MFHYVVNKAMNTKQSKRPPHISKAMKELRSYAKWELSKSDIVQFRVDKADFEHLVKTATELQTPMGAMVRQWVLERLESSTGQVTSKIE